MVKFATSPLMSTYLVAVVVGEYDFVEDTSSDGIKVSRSQWTARLCYRQGASYYVVEKQKLCSTQGLQS